jgi:phospholipid/cholesterol/gamma-HCH transport system substrate-binding protein
MAQRRLTWTDLRVGLFVLVGLIVVAMGIFYVTGQQGFWTAKYRLKTYLPEVEDLQTGAPVTLDGIGIGNVESTSLTPHPQDKEHNITVVMRIDRTYHDKIRSDSTASLVTQGALGNRYVSISRGLSGAEIPPWGAIPGKAAPQIQEVVQRSADVAADLQVLTGNVNEIVQKMNQGHGTIGKLMNDPALFNNLTSMSTKLDAMVTSVQQGNGSVGKLIASDELYNKVDDTVGKIDDAMTAVHDQKGTVGKLVYDPAMAENVKGIADKSNAMLADIRAGKGSLGKFVTEDAVYNELKDAATNVKNASAKLNSNEGTLGKMFSDPAFYDNMTGLSGDLRLLISDFRRNPKKFLQIKLGIF